MTYGYDRCLGKRRRPDYVRSENVYHKLIKFRAKKLEACRSYENRTNNAISVHGVSSQRRGGDENRTVRGSRAAQKTSQTQVHGSNLSRLRSVLPYVIEFLDTTSFVAVTRIIRRVPSFYYKIRFETKTACMIEYWMSKGCSFEWVYSNITSERVRLEALRYAKKLPNAREIGYKLKYIPLMMT